MNQFQYREIDSEGRETLEVIAGSIHFNKWMYDTIRPFCQGKILEIGSGIGNISTFFYKERADITLSDIRNNYREELTTKFPDVSDILNIDLVHPDFDTAYSAMLNQFDSVFALNVIEHIKDDQLAVKNCCKLLKPGGKLVVLVPAYQSLYNRFDRELEHYRRYNRKTLNSIMQKGGMQHIYDRYFNFMGILGWIVSGAIQKNKTIPKDQMSLFNKFVPIFKLIDLLVLKSVGLSVISVGVKT